MEKVLCIKDVIMLGTGDIAFTEGTEYKIVKDEVELEAIDNQGDKHGLGLIKDDFFKEHFKNLL